MFILGFRKKIAIKLPYRPQIHFFWIQPLVIGSCSVTNLNPHPHTPQSCYYLLVKNSKQVVSWVPTPILNVSNKPWIQCNISPFHSI